MAIQFNEIPGNLRVPFLRFEVNAGRNPYQSIARLLLIGQKRSTGSAPINQPILVSGDEDGLFGVGSMLAAMCKIARRNAPFQEIWAGVLEDAVGSTAATGNMIVATAPIAVAGTIVVYIGGWRVAVPVTTTMTNAQVATALAAAVNACDGIPVVASVAGGTPTRVDLTAHNKGTLGNTIRIETRMYRDDGPLADTMLTITQMSGGAGDPSITTLLANIGSEPFDWIVTPYALSSPLGEVEQFLNSRWGPMEQLYGHAITAMTDTHGAVQAFTSARNSPRSSVFAMNKSPQPTYILAAAVGAKAAQHLQDAPELSRPLQTINLVGILPPKVNGDRWSVVQRQSLYYSGASAYDVDASGNVRIERLITTYQRNPWGQPDMTWLSVNTIAQIMYGLRSIALGLTSTYPRSALMDENPGNIQGVATARDIRKVVVHEYRKLEQLGVFENTDLFSELLVVERAQNDPNRVDMYLPLDHVNQLVVIAANATTYLQYQQ